MHALALLFNEDSMAEFSHTGVDREFMQMHCDKALHGQCRLDLGEVATVELSITWLAENDMRALNARYRGKDSPTNVLSFPSGLPALVDDDGTILVLGDIALCPPIIQREAQQQQKRLVDHWAHMLTHASLHLCGYDHEDSELAADMETLETALLASSGISNPYGIQSS